MTPENFPNSINYPEIKPDDTDTMIRERCLVYLKGNIPYYGCSPEFLYEAEKMFKYVKSGQVLHCSFEKYVQEKVKEQKI